jgi:hypothetical protein
LGDKVKMGLTLLSAQKQERKTSKEKEAALTVLQ